MYIESPSTTVTNRGALWLGTPTFVWNSPWEFAEGDRLNPASSGTVPWAGALIATDGAATPIPRARGVEVMARPLVVARSDGAFDAFWAASPGAPAPMDTEFGQVWHAVFDGRRWTAPQLILEASSLRWVSSGASALAIGAATHVVVAGRSRTAGTSMSGFVHLHRRSERWTASWHRTGPFPPRYLSAAPGRDGSLLIAYIGSALGSRTESVKIVVRDSAARTIQVSTVHDFVDGDGHYVRLIKLSDEAYVVWAHSDGGATTPTRLIAARLTGVRPPRIVRSPTLMGGVLDFDLISLSDSSFQAIVATSTDRRLHAIIWSNGSWHAPEALTVEPSATAPTAVSTGRAKPSVAYGVARSGVIRGAPGARAPATFVISRAAGCQP